MKTNLSFELATITFKSNKIPKCFNRTHSFMASSDEEFESQLKKYLGSDIRLEYKPLSDGTGADLLIYDLEDVYACLLCYHKLHLSLTFNSAQ